MNIYDYLTCGVSNINADGGYFVNNESKIKFKWEYLTCEMDISNIPIIYNENFKKVWNLWKGQ